MKHAIAIVSLLAAAATANAQLTYFEGGALTIDGVPTPGLADYITYTVSLTSYEGIIFAADMDLIAPNDDFYHHMMGATVYADVNAFLPQPNGPMQDTQVPYVTNVDVLSAEAAETTGSFNAAWAFIGGAGNPLAGSTVAIVQMVLPDTSYATGSGIAVVDGQQRSFWFTPEPATLFLLGLGSLAVLRRRNR